MPRYTVAEPFNQDGTKPEQGKGWSLSTDYYAHFSPRDNSKTLVTFFAFEVSFKHPGSFFVQVEYEGEDGTRRCSVPSYINVEPVLKAGGEAMRCKELSIMTVISRCLGKVDNWKKVLAPVSNQNYNAVHLAPIQEYGESYSHYSIADQTKIAKCFFSGAKITQNKRIRELRKAMDGIRNELGMVGIIDIVLNHTASNSDWIKEHPESGFNLENTPRLWPAWLLDKELTDISEELS